MSGASGADRTRRNSARNIFAAVDYRLLSGANDNPAAGRGQFIGPAWESCLPPDARGVIEPVPRSNVQGGRRRQEWRLRFYSRHGQVADPLMGWTGGGDVLSQVELRFPDRQSAERYCQRQGIVAEVRNADMPRLLAPPKQAFQLRNAGLVEVGSATSSSAEAS